MTSSASKSQDLSHESSGRKAAGAFRTISEVAKELEVQQHVLRFWETKFSQVKPLTRGGGRRYYRPEDVDVLRKIHHILYSEGYTIKGAQNLLKGLSKNQVAGLALSKPSLSTESGVASDEESDLVVQQVQVNLSSEKRDELKEVLSDLMLIRNAFGA